MDLLAPPVDDHVASPSVAAALASMVSRHLDAVAARAAAVETDVDGIHRLRRALRAARTALSIHERAVPDERAAALRVELRWIARRLGEARDLEEFAASAMATPADGEPEPPGVATLRDAATARLEAARAEALAAVRSERFQALLDLINQWPRHGETAADQDSAALARFAADELRRRRRKMKKLGAAIAGSDAPARHSLRIAAKKLAFTIRAFAEIFPGAGARKGRKAMQASLKPLLRHLGDLNDIANHERLIGELALAAGESALFAAGYLAGQAVAPVPRLKRKAGKSLASFRACEPWWA